MAKHCVCRKGSNGFMILCERCIIWYHGSCVGETKETSAKIGSWFCAWCTGYNLSLEILSKKQEELFSQINTLKEAVQFKRIVGVRPEEQASAVDTLKKELDSKLLELGEFKATCENLEKKIELKDKELEHLKNNSDHLKEQLSVVKDTCKNNGERRKYQEEIDEYLLQISSLKEELKDMCKNNDEEKIKHQTKIDEYCLQISSLKEELKDRCKNNDDEKRKYKTEIDTSYSQIISLKLENKELKESLKIKRRTLSLSQH